MHTRQGMLITVCILALCVFKVDLSRPAHKKKQRAFM
uniref:Uncharacterized protein n=1 Tax=Anguilla anguilla TaxID=7936 RepID=A0A0E9VN03_ANGAN